MTLLDSLHIDADIARAWTLPAPFYIDPAIAAQERDKIFSRTWQVVGHRDQVPQPGDYFTTRLVDEPLLIVRGADHGLRGFYNVCRHRAGPPAEGCGSRNLFRCRYHGWTYSEKDCGSRSLRRAVQRGGGRRCRSRAIHGRRRGRSAEARRPGAS